MQRFKDFTKKSGKVASAILSAAMVTSMVAGTNVVYAATNNEVAEATTDVTANTTINNDQEAVRAAKADLEAAYKDLPVTACLLATDVAVGAGTALDDFQIPAKDIAKQYNVTIADGTIVTKNPTMTGTGTLTVTFDISRTSGEKVTAKVEYTLASRQDRQAAAEAAVKKALAEFTSDKLSNKTTPAEIKKVGDDALKATGGKHDSIPLFGDFDTTTSTAVVNAKTLALLNQRGAIEADYKAAQFAASAAGAAPAADATGGAEVIYSEAIPSNQERMDAAVAKVNAFLAKDARYLDANVDNEDKFLAGVTAYLTNIGYDDVKVEAAKTDSNGNTISKYEVVDPATQNRDGKATATYALLTDKTKFTNAAGTAITPTTYNDTDLASALETADLVLASDETKAAKALEDLKVAAAKVDVEANNSVADYNTALADILNDDLKDYKKTGKTFAFDTDTVTIKDFDDVYADVKATAEYTAKDASAGKDGNPKVELTATSETAKTLGTVTGATAETKKATVDYTIDSAQTTVDKAAVAVQAVLDAMNITNDTKDTDVMAAVEEAIKPYEGVVASLVTFDKANATADKEGTAKIVVELKDEKNGLTKTAGADKTIKFRSNTFVEENGAKFYYDKDGNKLQNTWLQGTDSPDGYTYYIQNDGSVMQDRLTYHPDGKHVIYFDKDGHEVFDAFVNVKKDVQGQDVDYIGYFDTFGYAYVNQTTYGNGEGAYAKDALFYINDYGVLENKGWFKNAAGEIGYAATNGTLTTSQWSLDQFGRKVYFQANGFLAKGLMTDGVKYYQLDETDGHLVGEF